MKKLFFISCLFLSIACLSQTVKLKPKAKAKAKPVDITQLAETMIPKGKLVQSTSLKDIIVLPKGCNVSGYYFSCTQGGNLHEETVKGGKFTSEMLQIFKKATANQVYVFERVKASCKVKKRYEVIVKP
jgi:hypothetical protein